MGNLPQEKSPKLVSRRDALKILGLTGTGLAAAAVVGCSSDETSPGATLGPTQNPTEISGGQTPLDGEGKTPEPTPNKELVSNNINLIPLWVTDQTPIGYPDGSGALAEGFRWVSVGLAIQNKTDEPLALSADFLDKANDQLWKTTMTTAQGYSYKPFTHSGLFRYGYTDIEPVLKLPPGYKLITMDSTQDVPSTYYLDEEEEPEETGFPGPSALNYTFQVPQNATGLKIDIPGYETVSLDGINGSEFGRAFPEEKLPDLVGASVMDPVNNVRLTFSGLEKTDIAPLILYAEPEAHTDYQAYRLSINYANLDQGYTSLSFVRMYAIDQNGTIFSLYDPTDNNAETLAWYGIPGFEEIGPGLSKDFVVDLIFPVTSKDVKFVVQGREFKVFDTPIGK